MKLHIVTTCLLALSVISNAQPTLTASTNNPVSGDNFILNSCNSSGVALGAGGAGVTWDYHTLIITHSMPYDFVTCTSTPYCDSFAGSNLTAILDTGTLTKYVYFTTNASLFEDLGEHLPGGYLYNYKPQLINKYPIVYNTSYMDTNINYFSHASGYTITYESVSIDGYGTLILPSGTYTNVLRRYSKSYIYDSTPGVAATTSRTTQSSEWFATDFHLLLLGINYDSSTSSGWSPLFVSYATKANAGIQMMNDDEVTFEISPNPVSDVLNIKLFMEETQNTNLTLTDITGNKVGTISSNDINSSSKNIQYSVKQLPAGLYFIHLANGNYSITKKIIVSH